MLMKFELWSTTSSKFLSAQFHPLIVLLLLESSLVLLLYALSATMGDIQVRILCLCLVLCPGSELGT